MPKKASSPAVTTESLLLSGLIDTKEICSIMTLDVPSTFAQCDMLKSINGKETIFKICRLLVDMLCEITLEVYKDFATCNSNNNNILYVNVLEPLCRMLKVSILCYQKFVRETSKM